MNDFANGFLKGYKEAIVDVTPSFFSCMDAYSGFARNGVFRYFLDNIKMEDINEEGTPYEVTLKEYLETCLEDWLVSHYDEIKRDFEEEEWFEQEHESEGEE